MILCFELLRCLSRILDVGVNALVSDLWKSLVALPVTTMKRVTVNPVRGMCEVFAEFF